MHTINVYKCHIYCTSPNKYIKLKFVFSKNMTIKIKFPFRTKAAIRAVKLWRLTAFQFQVTSQWWRTCVYFWTFVTSISWITVGYGSASSSSSSPWKISTILINKFEKKNFEKKQTIRAVKKISLKYQVYYIYVYQKLFSNPFIIYK